MPAIIILHPAPPIPHHTVPTLTSRPTATQATPDPRQHALLLQPSVPQLLQLPDVPVARATVVHLLAVDEAPGWSRPAAVLDLAFPVHVRPGDVEGVDVGREDAADEQDAVDQDVRAEAGNDADGGGWEEDIDQGEADA